MQIDIDSIKSEIFKSIPQHMVANIIAENNVGLKITSKLIESYIELASTKEFTLDKTIFEIRKLNNFNLDFEDKLVFELNDKSKVAINHDTMLKLQEHINNVEIVQFMRKNKENFINVVNATLEG